MVSTTTWVRRPLAARTRGMAARLGPPGMLRSSTSTSGSRACTMRTAESASPVSPITRKPSSPCRRRRSPERTTRWSSASTMVISRTPSVTGQLRLPDGPRPRPRAAQQVHHVERELLHGGVPGDEPGDPAGHADPHHEAVAGPHGAQRGPLRPRAAALVLGLRELLLGERLADTGGEARAGPRRDE